METRSPFGSYAIIKNVRHAFKNEPDLWWEIKPPTAGDELALTTYMSKGKAIYTKDGALETEDSPSWLDVLFFQISTLFGGTNIPKDPNKKVSDAGTPFISAEAPLEEVMAKLKTMPMDMVAEIADAIAESIPGWGPKNPLSRTAKKED